VRFADRSFCGGLFAVHPLSPYRMDRLQAFADVRMSLLANCEG